MDSCIAYGVGFMNRAGGLQAWRWLFILEGAPSGEKSPLRLNIRQSHQIDLVLQLLSAVASSSFFPATRISVAGSPRKNRLFNARDSARWDPGLFSRWPFACSVWFSKINSKQKITWVDAKATLLDLRLYAHYLAYVGLGCLIGSLSLFAPTIVLGLGFEGLRAQLFTVPPYAAAFLTTIAASFLSDRFNTRGLIVGSSLSICFLAFTTLGQIEIQKQ